MESKKIFILTPLNTMNFSYQREIDPGWLAARISIMQQFTAKSLAAQSNQNFEWHILTRPETMQTVMSQFKPIDHSFILTVDESEQRIDIAAGESEKLYLIRLNSDDCYHQRFIDLVEKHPIRSDTEALMFQCGYMWHQKEDRIIERDYPSPPFYILVYNSIEFKHGKRYDIAGHNHVRKVLRTECFKERMWLWLVNEWNNKILRGSAYPDPMLFPKADKSVLKEFGL